MAHISWKEGVSGDWSNGADWSNGHVPGAHDSVLIDAAGGYTISVTVAEQAMMLTIKAAGAELAVDAALNVGALVMTTGALSISVDETLTAGGRSSIGMAGANGPYIGGSGTFLTTGTTKLATQKTHATDVTIAGGVTWVNSGNVTVGGAIDIGNGYDQGATITNLAGGVFDLSSDSSTIVQLNPNDSAIFNNAGLLEKTGKAGNSSIGAYVNNTGTIDVAAGTLSFALGGTFGGAIEGAGVTDFTGGTAVITASVAPSIGVYGGTVNLASTSLGAIGVVGGTLGVTGESAISGPLTVLGGSMAFGAGEVLTVQGSASFGVTGANGPYIGGAGTLITDGAVILAAQGAGNDDVNIAGGVTWVNSGNVTVGGAIDIGNGYDQGATITNLAGGVFDLSSDSSTIVQLNPNDSAIFNNAGLLEKTGKAGNSSIGAYVNNTGTIDVAAGTLSFALGGTFGGAIEGAGVTDFTGGTAVITASVAPSIGVYGGTVNLASTSLGAIGVVGGTLGVTGESAISGPLTVLGGSMAFGAGEVLTVQGSASFGVTGANGPYIGGAGTLITDGAVILAAQGAGNDDVNIAGGVTWVNSGSVTVGGAIDIGNGYDQGATITNLAGGVFDLSSDSSTIVQLNPNDSAIFNNAGTLQASAGSGTINLGAYVGNSGTIKITSGMLNLQNGGALGGTVTGAGTLTFGGATGFMPTKNTIEFIHPKCINDSNASIGYGAVTFLNAFTNDGTLSTSGGLITCTDELKGTGTITLGGLGTVELLAGSTSTQTVDFQPNFGDLGLGVPLLYQGMIDGFGAGDTIDLLLTPATELMYNAGVLLVFDGSTTVATLHFSGSYTPNGFGLAPDGNGGTLIGYTPPS